MDGVGVPHPAAAEALAAAMQALLAGSAGAEPFLRGWPTLRAVRPVAPRPLPVLAWLAAARASAAPSTAALVAMLDARAGQLAWGQTYTAAEVGPAFLDRYGWTEIIGSRGPVPSARVAAGFLLLGPETHYPAHAHAAEELYVPLAGVASWMRDEEGFVEREVGEAIHHPSWTPHAMRTGADPLLALYVWQGHDLGSPSRIMPRDVALASRRDV